MFAVTEGNLMTHLAIAAEELTKTDGDVTAVHSLDLEVPTGTVLSLLAPNGAVIAKVLG